MSEPENIFGPVKNKRTFEEVSSKIKKLVFDGVLKPGDKLPAEAALAKKFGVGRQTIREALRILELTGFITIQTGFGGGSVIKDTILDRISHLYLDAFQMRKITVDELAETRLVIEKAIIEAVIDHADENDIKKLEENINRSKQKIEKGLMATDESFEFHRLLANASQNHMFLILERSINAIHLDQRSRSVPNLDDTKKALHYHEEILTAIMEKDRDRAIKSLEQHIQHVRDSHKSASIQNDPGI